MSERGIIFANIHTIVVNLKDGSIELVRQGRVMDRRFSRDEVRNLYVSQPFSVDYYPLLGTVHIDLYPETQCHYDFKTKELRCVGKL